VRISGGVSRWRRARIPGWVQWLPASLCLLASSVSAQAPMSTQGPPERRIPERSAVSTAALQGKVRNQWGRAVPAVAVELRSKMQSYTAVTNAEGIFRLRDLRLGEYELRLTHEGFETRVIKDVKFETAGLIVLEVDLQALTNSSPENVSPSGVPGAPRTLPRSTISSSPYPGIRNPATEIIATGSGNETVPAASDNFASSSDRWDVAMPE